MFSEIVKYQRSIFDSKAQELKRTRDEMISLQSKLDDLKKNLIANIFMRERRIEISNLTNEINNLSSKLSALENERDEALKNSNPEIIYNQLFGGDLKKMMSFMEEKGIPLIYGYGGWSHEHKEGYEKEQYHSLDEVCLVRMTGAAPKNDEIEPSFYSDYKKVGEDYDGNITVHFALNGVVCPHSNGSWEDKKYSIIQPMDEEIMDRLDVFSGVDSFSQGTFKIKNGYIICPINEMETIKKDNPSTRVIGYDPEKTSAYDITNSFISSLGYTTESQVQGVTVYNKYGIDRFKELKEKYQKIDCLFRDSWQVRYKGNKVDDELTEKNLNYYLNMIREQNISPSDMYKQIVIDAQNRDYKGSTMIPTPPSLNVSSIYLSYVIQTILEKRIDANNFTKVSESILHGQLNIDELLSVSKRVVENSDKFEDPYSDDDGFSDEELSDICQKALQLDFERSEASKNNLLAISKENRSEMKYVVSKLRNNFKNFSDSVDVIKAFLPFYTNNYPGDDLNAYFNENLNSENLYWINENVKIIATSKNQQSFDQRGNLPEQVEVPNFNLPVEYNNNGTSVFQQNPESVKSIDVVKNTFLPILFSQRVYAEGIPAKKDLDEESSQQHSI